MADRGQDPVVDWTTRLNFRSIPAIHSQAILGYLCHLNGAVAPRLLRNFRQKESSGAVEIVPSRDVQHILLGDRSQRARSPRRTLCTRVILSFGVGPWPM